LSSTNLCRANLRRANLRNLLSICNCDFNGAMISYRGKTVRVKFEEPRNATTT
jgi:uncharacterized protein YjbI with pentapeptide repeats